MRDVSVWLAVFRVVVVVVVKLFEIEVGLLVERYGCERNLSSLLLIDRATLLIFSDLLLCGADNRAFSYCLDDGPYFAAERAHETEKLLELIPLVCLLLEEVILGLRVCL